VVARRLGVDAQTVRNWIHSGKLPAVSFGPDGTVVRVDPAELDKLRAPRSTRTGLCADAARGGRAVTTL
jgi:excisionase family DNA binding protein